MDDKLVLSRLENLIKELKQTDSKDEKKSILFKYQDLRRILSIIYDKNYRFNITGDNILNHYEEKDIPETGYSPYLYSLLDDLRNRKISGKYALDCCAEFIEEYIEFKDTIVKLFNKDLKCGVSTYTIEKVFNEIISSFKIPLANKYKRGVCDFEKETWFCSRKLDGIRCIAIIIKNNVKFYSRTGKEFFTLDNLKQDVLNITDRRRDMILDGEICVLDPDGNENFKETIRQIRRKDYTIENPHFFIFDCWETTSFNRKKDVFTFEEKYSALLKMHTKWNPKHLSILSQEKILNKGQLKALVLNMPAFWEGLMLRNNNPSQFKRSNSLLKIKKFREMEFIVTETHNGYKDDMFCCTSIAIKYKGNPVGIGSGMDDQQRIDWYKNPEKILGKTVTIKYFEETMDKTGKASLRFPVLKTVHGVRRDV